MKLIWMSRQLATVFGLGYVPKASGTWGSLAAIPLVFLFQYFGELGYLFACLVTVVLGTLAASLYCTSSQMADPQEVVIDEVAGYLIAMAWLPLTPFFFIGTFLLFRALDIVKPPPVSFFDRKVKGGIGVMSDDIVAGILTNMFFQWVYQSGMLDLWV